MANVVVARRRVAVANMTFWTGSGVIFLFFGGLCVGLVLVPLIVLMINPPGMMFLYQQFLVKTGGVVADDSDEIRVGW